MKADEFFLQITGPLTRSGYRVEDRKGQDHPNDRYDAVIGHGHVFYYIDTDAVSYVRVLDEVVVISLVTGGSLHLDLNTYAHERPMGVIFF